MRLALAVTIATLAAGGLRGDEPAADLRQRLDEELTAMEFHGSAYNPKPLDELGVAGLVGVLDHFFPETAAAKVEVKPDEAEIKRLIAELASDDFRTREAATGQLIARARPSRELLVRAAGSDDAEVRLRAERILAAWEPKIGDLGDRSLGGLWNYVEKIRDGERLDVLARRVVAELGRGWPEGRKLHHLRLCIAGLAKGGNETSCEHLRPLVASKNLRIATFVTETVGSYKSDEEFFPPLLLDALASERDEVTQVAVRWTANCSRSSRARDVQRALRAIFDTRGEALKFQVCLPLIQEYDDADAWVHLIGETQSKAPLRAAAALSSLADAKYSGREASRELLDKLEQPLASPTLSLRWGATKALGTHGGAGAIERLIPLLADGEQSVRDEAARCLAKQADKALVRERLEATASKSDSDDFRRRAADVLKKLDEKTTPAITR